MLAKVVLDPQDVGADAFAAVGEAIAVTLQTSFAEHHLVVSICAMHHDLQGILAGALEAQGIASRHANRPVELPPDLDAVKRAVFG
ncbi:MAG: hypothetical protein E6I75_04090 [Chloroflexi bacterium]|nr:MAG: hypothetical protein E6I75_04090 [Chloroflexota bacterium]